jgi:hypothetical protein
MDGVTATTAELNFVDGVTSNIQTQLDATLDTAGTGIDISSTTISVDVSDFMANGADNRVLTATGTDAMNAEANLTFDGTDLKLLGDDLEMRWGAGQDFKIYVNSDEAYLVNVREDKDIRFMVNDGNGTSGANITALKIDASSGGSAIFSHDIVLPDAGKVTFGAGSDLQIYHDGTNNVINTTTQDADLFFVVNDGGTTLNAIQIDASDNGNVFMKNDNQYLFIGAGNDIALGHNGTNSVLNNNTGTLQIRNVAADTDMFLSVNDSDGNGHINAIQIDASAAGSVFMPNDNATLGIGAGNDLRLFHDGTDSYMYNYQGELRIGNTVDDADTVLYGDDGSGGVTAYLTLDGSSTRTNVHKDLRLDNSVNLQLGGGGDMSMSHDGSGAIFSNAVGNLTIQTSTDDGDVIFKCDDGSGGVTAYLTLDGSATEVDVHKNMRFDDSKLAVFGNGGDMYIYHDGTNNHIRTDAGDMILHQNTDDKDIIFKCDDGSGGVTPYITLDGSEVRATFDVHTRFNDNKTVQIGSSADLQLYHDASNSYIAQTGTGDLIIQQSIDDKDIIFKCDDGGGGMNAYLTLDGSATQISIAKNMKFGDGVKTLFGAGEDVQLFHDSTYGGFLFNQTNDFFFDQVAADKDWIFRVDDSDGGGDYQEVMRIQGSTQRVGIGTSSPTEKLTVAGAITSTGALADDRTSTAAMDFSSGVTRFVSYGASGTAGSFSFRNAAGGASSTERMRIDSNGTVVVVGSQTIAGALTANFGATFNNTSNDSDFRVKSVNNSNMLRVDAANDRVGIGTGTPGEKLEVSGGKLLVSGGQVRSGSYLEGFPSFSFANDTDTGMFSDTANQLEFSTGGSSRLTIDSSGNVGIGTSSPRVRLDLGSNGISHLRWGTWSELGELSSHNSLILGNNIYVDGSSAEVRATTSDGYRAITMKYNEGITFHAVQASVSAGDAIGNERMRIDPSGNVGIGETSPEAKLHVKNASAGTFTASNSQLLIENNTTVRLSMVTPTNNASKIEFGDVDDQDAGILEYNNSDNSMRFTTNTSERMRIDSDGNLKFADNGSNPSAAANTAFLFNDGGEMKVLDELGNTTTISPHNFELIPDGASEDMAFAYHSTRHTPEGKLKKVNVDMMKLARLVEQLTGEKLVYIEEGE